jgi:hypothetical protein
MVILIVPSDLKEPPSALPIVVAPVAVISPYWKATPVGSNVFMWTKNVLAGVVGAVHVIRQVVFRGMLLGSRLATLSVQRMFGFASSPSLG